MAKFRRKGRRPFKIESIDALLARVRRNLNRKASMIVRVDEPVATFTGVRSRPKTIMRPGNRRARASHLQPNR